MLLFPDTNTLLLLCLGCNVDSLSCTYEEHMVVNFQSRECSLYILKQLYVLYKQDKGFLRFNFWAFLDKKGLLKEF